MEILFKCYILHVDTFIVIFYLTTATNKNITYAQLASGANVHHHHRCYRHIPHHPHIRSF